MMQSHIEQKYMPIRDIDNSFIMDIFNEAIVSFVFIHR